MRGLRPIPVRLLADDAVVRVPDGAGVFAEGVAVSRVRFVRTQSVSDDAHRSADAGAGKVYVDALNSVGAFEGGEVVRIGCEDEAVSIDGADARADVTLSSDFFSLAPGDCNLTFTGCSSHVTTFHERWL